jgi:hypothetical protein
MQGKPDPKSSKYLGKIGEKPLFLFASHGAGAASDHAIKGMEVAKSFAPDSDIWGTYSCQGEVDQKILEKASKKTRTTCVADGCAERQGPSKFS